MSANKISPYIGEDGELYFNYAVGAEYKFSSAGVKFIQRIVSCEYEDGKEYYRLESAGKLLPSRFSIAELETMLGRLPYEQTATGEREKLPLLKEEVEQFYAQRARERNFANAEENKKLKGTEYFKLMKACGTQKKQLMLAQAEQRTADIEELQGKIKASEESMAKLIKEKKVDLSVLSKTVDCERCYDTGFVGGEICECALERAEQIKAFNAALRRAARKK